MKEKKIQFVQKILINDPDIASISSFTGGKAVNQGNIFISLKDKKLRKTIFFETQARLSKNYKIWLARNSIFSLPIYYM